MVSCAPPLNYEEDIHKAYGGIVRGGFAQYLDASRSPCCVVLVDEIPGIISETIDAVVLKRISRHRRDAQFPTIRKSSREQEFLHASLRSQVAR